MTKLNYLIIVNKIYIFIIILYKYISFILI